MLGKEVSPKHNCSAAFSFCHSSRSCTPWRFFLADQSEEIWRISGQTKCLNSAGEHWEESPSSLKIHCPLQPKSANLPSLYMIIQLLHSKQQHLNQTHAFASPFWGAEQAFTSHLCRNEIPLCQWKPESQRQQIHIILWERVEKKSKQKRCKEIFCLFHNWLLHKSQSKDRNMASLTLRPNRGDRRRENSAGPALPLQH